MLDRRVSSSLHRKSALHMDCAGLLLALEDRCLSLYWLLIQASPTAAWNDLDGFLRHFWVECCGHLSCLNHAGTTFAYDVDGAHEWAANPRSMAEQIADTITEQYRSMVLTMAWATLRIGEVIGLRPSNLDLSTGTQDWQKLHWHPAVEAAQLSPLRAHEMKRLAAPGAEHR